MQCLMLDVKDASTTRDGHQSPPSLWVWIGVMILVGVVSIGIGFAIGYAILKKPSALVPSTTTVCPPSNSSIRERYGELVGQILEESWHGGSRDDLYNDLAFFLDNFGPRYFGSESLDRATDFLEGKLLKAGFDRVHLEPVYARVWKRGQETARVNLKKFDLDMKIVGLGGSPGCTIDWTKIFVAKNLSEITKNSSARRVVVFNPIWTDYETASAEIGMISEAAAKAGAYGVLIKSPTPFSVYSPHAEQQDTSKSGPIPAAMITVEDAEMLQRMHERGDDVSVSISMRESRFETAQSRNLIAEITGSRDPSEIILISAQLDSWDISYGALESAAGALLCVHVMEVIRKIHPKPARTIRMVLWTGAEQGSVGSISYFENHQHEKHVFAMELDRGIFSPGGLSLATRTKGNQAFYDDVLNLFEALNSSNLNYNPNSVGKDIQPFVRKQGVPTATLLWKHNTLTWNYFLTFLHTEGDRMPQIDKSDCRLSNGVLASVVYVLADALETMAVYEKEQSSFRPHAKPLIFEVNDNKTLPYPEWYPFELRGSGDHKTANPWHSSISTTEFDSYNSTVDEIYELVISGSMKGEYFDRLAAVSDLFGSRKIGIKGLSKATEYVMEILANDSLDHVHTEDVQLQNWVRGKEHAEIVAPYPGRKIKVLGLGGSPPTPSAGITAGVLVVANLTDLDAKGHLARGKIVLFAPPEWKSYGFSSRLRVTGADRARRYGAVAALIRSATPRGVYTSHGGLQEQGNGTHIPSLAITVADADMLRRMSERTNITIYLQVDSHTQQNPITSQNIVAELTGCEKPQEIVLISGHFDSWDVGTGSMDDGVGAFLSWQTLWILRRLKLCPKRTIRMVMWTGEEIGGAGSHAYYKRHENESIIFAAESDLGVFKPGGLFMHTEHNRTLDRVKVILDRFGSKVNASALIPYPGSVGEDVVDWDTKGIPGMMPYHQDFAKMYDYYFTFHHSRADRMTLLKSDHLDLTSYLWTVVTYIVADADEPFE